MDSLAHSARSFLYVPGDRPDLVRKALASEADAVILDTEDSVTPANRQSAMEHARASVARAPDPDGPEIWVRIHPELVTHVQELVGPGLRGLVVPEAESHAHLVEVHARLESSEETREGCSHDVALLPLIESARGLERLAEICGSPRVLRLGMGEADLRADLGLDPGDDELELLPHRTAVVTASAAAGLAAPLGSTSTDFRDLERLRVTTERLRRLGFRGRTAIHPDQLSIVNQVFTPSGEELARARDVLNAFEDLQRNGRGTGLAPDGTMIDEAVVRSARSTIRRAGVTVNGSGDHAT